jgi:hypothetical protein
MNPSVSAAEQVRFCLRNWGLSCALCAHARCTCCSRSWQLRAVAQTQAALRAAKWECRRRWLRCRSQPRSSLPSAGALLHAAGAAPASATNVTVLQAALAEAQAAAEAAKAEAAKERLRGAQIQKRAVAGMEDLTKLCTGHAARAIRRAF